MVSWVLRNMREGGVKLSQLSRPRFPSVDPFQGQQKAAVSATTGTAALLYGLQRIAELKALLAIIFAGVAEAVSADGYCHLA